MAMGTDEVRAFVVGPIQTNCYAYVSEGECMVVDAGYAGDQIAEALSDVHVSLIVSTHGHGDHTGGVRSLCEATGAPFAMSEGDLGIAMATTGDGHHPGEEVPPEPARLLSEGDEITVGTATFHVIETPGHTAGGICLLGDGTAEGVAFVGDTLFAGSAGRTDLESGDHAELMRSLARLCDAIPPDTAVLCGHGSTTIMERELATNPFLQM